MAANDKGKTLNLRITADTRGLQKGVADAQRALGGLLKTQPQIGKLGSSLGEIGDQLQGKGKFSAALGQKDVFTQHSANLGKLMAEVKKVAPALKPAQSEMDQFLGKFTKLQFAVDAIKKSFELAGNYVKGAFERAKIDPALEGLDRLRKRTEEWTKSWETTIDRILSKIAGAAVDLLEEGDKQEAEKYTASAVQRHRGEALFAAQRAFRQTYGHNFNPDDPNRWDVAQMQREAGTFRALYLQALKVQRERDIADQLGRNRLTTQAGLGGVVGLQFAGGAGRGAGDRAGQKPGAAPAPGHRRRRSRRR